jgi:hypothetical protein
MINAAFRAYKKDETQNFPLESFVCNFAGTNFNAIK